MILGCLLFQFLYFKQTFGYEQRDCVNIKPEDIRQLYDNSQPLIKILISFLSASGMRISSTLWLQKKHIIFETRPAEILIEPHTAKSKKKSTAYLNTATSDMLKEYLSDKDDEDYLFPILPGLFRKRKTLRVVEHEQLQVIFMLRRSAPKRIKGIISPHVFHHLFADRLYQSKVDILILQKLLNHADIKSTMSYNQEKVKDAYQKVMN